MRRGRRTAVWVAAILSVMAIIYLVLNQRYALDRTNQTMGIYDFIPVPAEVEVLVEGTGKQIIDGTRTATKLKLVSVKSNTTSVLFEPNSEIIAYEYFAVSQTRQLAGLHIVPRSVYNMGTSYKRLGKGEQKVVFLTYNQTFDKLWIMPSELLKR